MGVNAIVVLVVCVLCVFGENFVFVYVCGFGMCL